MVGKMEEAGAVYDITDDWASLSQRPSSQRRVHEQDAELCRGANAVIVCSKRLFELKRTLTKNLHLVPNGVHAEHYDRVANGVGSLPSEAMQWPRPVLGYTGTIHPDRIDVELLMELSKRLGHGSIVLIGPNHFDNNVSNSLRRLGNVFLPGAVAYAEISEYMRAFDVCIVPHRVTPFTESLNPIKLWEYLATGKPIVSTPVAGFRDYPQFVRIAETAETFHNEAIAAVREAPHNGEARREEARTQSWRSRWDAIEEIIRNSPGLS
jgi:glycosyltransferase involved in cell wall biosynthesis